MSESNTTPKLSTTTKLSLRTLRAGPITALLDVESGFLRRIRLGEVELLRGIYGAVRDRDWNTVAPLIDELEINETNDRFDIGFRATHRRNDIDFQWRGTISCAADGTLEYSFDGEARSNFHRNRIGLCVLHPIAECAGKPCVVEHTDGSIEHGRFPALVSPHQPFFDLRSIQHEAAPGVRVKTRFEGDVFEMEDQRNWTDASFKTYSTPLALHFPVAVEPGTHVRQSVTLQISATTLHANHPSPGHVVDVRLSDGPRRPRPSIGFEWIPREVISAPEIDALGELAPAHLRVDLRPDGTDCKNRLNLMRDVAQKLPAINWHPAVFLGEEHEAELATLANELATGPRLNVSLFLILPSNARTTPPDRVDEARRRLAPLFPNAEFAAGTDAYCAELNRNRPAPDLAALPCFSLNPQVHAFDDLSLMETLAAQSHVVETIADFTGKPVVISPITLRPRFNPNATSTASAPIERAADPRQVTDFCAAWTLGTLAGLATQGSVHSLTCFELAGPRGLFELHPATRDVTRFPVFRVFHDLAEFSMVEAPEVSRPDQVAALRLFHEDGRERLLLANLTAGEQIVRITRADGRPVLARFAAGSEAIGADADPLEPVLRAFEYVALDLTNKGDRDIRS